MILLFLFSWRFATKDQLDIKCQLCRSIVRKLQANPDFELNAVEGSSCATNPEDETCSFIQYVVSQSKKVSNISRLCLNMLACPKAVTGYEGMHCSECVDLGSHLLIHRQEDRRKAFDYYCMTQSLKTLGFCGGIIDDGADDFIEDLSELSNAMTMCMSHGYCRIRRPDAGVG